jgi:hypothetical protein
MRSKDVLLLHPSHSAHTQATAGSVHWQPYRGMGLDGANQEETQAKQYSISGCQKVYINIIIYVQLVLFSYGAFLKYLVRLVLIVTIF